MARGRLAHWLHRAADAIAPAAPDAGPPAGLAEVHQEVPVDPSRLTIGRGTYIQPAVHAHPDQPGHVTIGPYGSIAPGCEIWIEPRLDPTAVAAGDLDGLAPPPPRVPLDVTIGADCWLATGVRVLGGVHIGDGAVLAAHAVVTDDVRPYAVVAGNPAVEVRRRFPDEVVDALLRIRWWDWSHEEILARGAELCDDDVRAFVQRYDPGR